MSKNLFIDNELGEIRLESIGQDITLRGGPKDTNVAGGGVKILATTGSGTGGGSNIEITAGATGSTSTSSGGNLTFYSGNAQGASGAGGDIVIKGGYGPGGGPITLSGGSGNGFAGGIAQLLGGRSWTNVGGAVLVAGGRGSTGGGAATVRGGSTTGAATGGPGGALSLRGGQSDQNGGDVSITGGDFATNGATNDGGDVLVRSGRRSALSEGSGEARVFLEKATGEPGVVGAIGGKIDIYAGDGRTTAGNIDIHAGDGGSAAGSAGNLLLTAGQSTNTDGGNIIFTSGARNAASNHGEFQFMHPGSDSSYSVGLQLWDENSANYVKLGVPVGDFGSNIDFIFPQFTGLGGQFLTTDGLGNLNWGNPASVSASGGGQIQSDGSYAPEGGAGLGIGQTWTGSNLAGSTRFANVTYTNSSTCPIAIAITFSTGDDTNSAILVNGVEVSKWDVEGLGSAYFRTLYAVVPAGQSYVGFVRGSTINYWTEMTTTGSCASPGGLGVNQAWLGQSRALNTVYTNNSGSPIAISIKLGVANAATATLRVNNSGAPGAGDEVDQFNATTIGSNADDNFVTLFGIVPDGGQYDVTTSGSVTNFGWYELRGPTPVNGGGLGVGQTWGGDLGPSGSATRAANTAYENTDSCPRHIQVRLNGITDTRVQTGASAGTLTDVSRQDPGGVSTTNHSAVITVPAGRFYRINTSDTITSWKEMSGGTCSAAALVKIIDADLDTFVRVAQSATGDEDAIEMRVGDNSGNFDVTNDVMSLSTAGVTIQVPDANGTSGTENGGSVTIEAGDGDSGGTGGAIFLQPGYGGSGPPAIPTGVGTPEPTELWFVDAQGTPQYVGFKAPSDISAASTGDGANTVWTLPEGDGSNGGEVLKTDGAGILSWATNNILTDADGDTLIQVEESADEDSVRIDLGDSPPGYGAVPNALVMSALGLVVNMGTATAADTAGAGISLTAGSAGVADGAGGGVTLIAGDGVGSGNGGDVNIQAGTGFTSGSGTGFAGSTVRVIGGTAAAGNTNSTGIAGYVFIRGGSGGTGSSNGGAVDIRGGVPGANPLNSQGGQVTIRGGGPSAGNTGSGGDITILGGEAKGAIDASTGRPGFVNILGGGGTGSYDGSGGEVLIRGGEAGGSAASTEKGGDITLIGGNSASGTTTSGGYVKLQTGDARGIGSIVGPTILSMAASSVTDPAGYGAAYMETQNGVTDWPAELRFMQGGGLAVSPYDTNEWVSLRGPVDATDINDVILTLRNTVFTNVADTADGANATGFTFTKVQDGNGATQPEISHINCLPAASLAASGPADYWTFNDGTTSYYVWYQSGTSADPTPAGTGIQVTLGGGETAKGVAQATDTAIGGSGTTALSRIIPGVILTLPATPGTSNQVLATDGLNPATMSWQTVGSGLLSFPLLANPNGVAGAPAYSFNGKSTVGMYSDAVNTIGLSTDGDPRVVITNTATTLKREGGVEHQLRFEDGTDGTYVGLQAPNNVTTQVIWALPVADGTTDGEVMATNGSGELKFQKMEFIYSSAGTPATSHVISHNLSQQYVTYTIWDRSTNLRINNAATETATDANTLTLTFTVAQDIIVAIMGVPGLGVNT